MVKKKKIAVIGIVIAMLVMGVFGYYKYNENQISRRKKEVTLIYHEITQGDVYQEVQKLTDKNHDFLSVNISQKKIEHAKELVDKQQQKIDIIKKREKRLSTKETDHALKNLTESLAIINKKYDYQKSLNDLFENKTVLNGSEISRNCVLKEEVTASKIEQISKKIQADKELSAKWKEAMLSIIKDGSDQATIIQKLLELLEALYEGDKPRADISEEEYLEATKLLETIKNETVKKKYESKVLAIKTAIEAEQRGKMEWSSMEEAIEFLKNVLANEMNASYQIKNFIVFEDKVWTLQHKEGNLIDVSNCRTQEPGGNAGGAVVYRLEKKEGLVDLTYYGGAFYPNEPDKRYEVDSATYKINSETDLIAERLRIERENRPPFSEVIEIFYTVIHPIIQNGEQGNSENFDILEGEDKVEINPRGTIWTCVARPTSKKIDYQLKDFVGGKFEPTICYTYDLNTKEVTKCR